MLALPPAKEGCELEARKHAYTSSSMPTREVYEDITCHLFCSRELQLQVLVGAEDGIGMEVNKLIPHHSITSSRQLVRRGDKLSSTF
jgi:hypothetical protein